MAVPVFPGRHLIRQTDSATSTPGLLVNATKIILVNKCFPWMWFEMKRTKERSTRGGSRG